MSSLSRRSFVSRAAGATVALALQPAQAWAKRIAARDLTKLTLHEVSALVQRRTVSPVELTQACLARIEKYDSKINAFITLTPERALEQARAAETEILHGRWRGPLHGIPIALKDNIDTAGLRTTAASAMFVDRVPTADAEVVRRLKQAGTVLLGKLNMDEFADGGGSIHSYWGPVHNPWSPNHVAGGSSGGSAAALAADFCFGTLGTDTGGSIRIPASFCGVVGLKPTYGLVSNRGVIPLAKSLDHVGPLGKTVLDAALLLQGVAGYDPLWPGSAQTGLPDYAAAIRAGGTSPRLGIPKAYFFDRLDPEVAQLMDEALGTLRTMATVTNDNVIVPNDRNISSDVAISEICAYQGPLFERGAGLFQPRARKLLARLCKTPVSGAAYVNAHQTLQEARRHVADLFSDDIDLLVMPTWKDPPLTPDVFHERFQAGENAAPELLNTAPFNWLGLPAISIPCGFTKGGLPVGLQVVGRPFAEGQVLALAHAYEQATQWHLRTPAL